MDNSAKSENGFTRVANELLDAMFNAHLSARQWAVCMALIRKTFGYNKTEDDIGLSQLAAMTKIAKSHVSTAINEMVARNIIHKRQGGYGHILAINTQYSSWGKKAITANMNDLAVSKAIPTLVKLVPAIKVAEAVTIPETVTIPEAVMVPGTVTNGLPNREKGDYQIGKTGVTESVTTKDNLTKESLQKTTPKENIASPTMRERFERFYSIYPKKKSKAVAEKAFCKIAPDEQLLASMLLGIERAKNSAQWANPQMIPYPASWLNAQGWLDDIQTDYQPDERAVIQTFNRVLGEQLGSVDSEGFVESRAGAIRHFLTLSKKPNWVSVYFSYVKMDCDIPPKTGFDWLIKPETFAKVREGQFQIERAA